MFALKCQEAGVKALSATSPIAGKKSKHERREKTPRYDEVLRVRPDDLIKQLTNDRQWLTGDIG